MKKFSMILMMVVLFCTISIAQPYIYEGIDLFNYDDPPEGFTDMNDGLWQKSEVGPFKDVSVFLPPYPNVGILFVCTEESGEIFTAIYDTLISIMGRVPDLHGDKIPNEAKYNYNFQVELIRLGVAKFVRVWLVNNTYLLTVIYVQHAIYVDARPMPAAFKD